MAKRYTYTQANGGASVLTALNTISTYVRDLRGTLTARADTVGSATFHHWYEYDSRGLLWKVFASTTDVKPASPDVTYTYRPSGQVESRQLLGEPQPVPLRYTIREQLEQIGDPAGTLYPFSAFYAYHGNGTVKEAEFYNAGSPAAEKRYRYVLGTASYDALNRLKSADFEPWIGGWGITAAHDLANIMYDAAGNLRALQRWNQAGALIDDLTYSYDETGTNRLTSIADLVSGNAETWDARSGAFTYDANGNLKTAPAPYGITAVTYDHQNLALSLTSNGAITAYRYNEAGQRITKQVGTGNTEVYLLDGATSLGVFTVNGSGSPTSWYFNIIAGGEKVIGRQPSVGNRRYYHADLLGSTRAVVEGTTVVESYDFEPWGLLMPGRTLAGPTKEGFTGKEQDAETGLDYFGARYYMPALARWTAVDPLAEKHPEWAPYNYVLNNPLALIDPDGRQEEATGQCANKKCHQPPPPPPPPACTACHQPSAPQQSGSQPPNAERRQQLITAQDNAIKDPRFQPVEGGPTYCNFATCTVARTMSAPMGPLTDANGYDLKANKIGANLAKPGSGYRAVSAEEAQQLANQGILVIVSLIKTDGPGHVATVRPNNIPGETPGGSAGPVIANVGVDNDVGRLSLFVRRGDIKKVVYYTPEK